MDWIYLSPHLDDAVLSCGGLIWEQVQSGLHVENWTICAGDPPGNDFSPFAIQLHTRWGNAPAPTGDRRDEDGAANTVLGATWQHLPQPDCIYRTEPGGNRHLYATEESICGALDPREMSRIEELAQELDRRLPANAQIVTPLTLGGHVDHQMVRQAVESTGRRLLYYADYPYVLKTAAELVGLEAQGWLPLIFSLSPGGLDAWISAITCYKSQISSFWNDETEMAAAIRAYAFQMGGSQPAVRLWQPPQ